MNTLNKKIVPDEQLPPLPALYSYCHGTNVFEGSTLTCERRQHCLCYRALQNRRNIPLHNKGGGIYSHACYTYYGYDNTPRYSVDEFCPIETKENHHGKFEQT